MIYIGIDIENRSIYSLLVAGVSRLRSDFDLHSLQTVLCHAIMH